MFPLFLLCNALVETLKSGEIDGQTAGFLTLVQNTLLLFEK